MTHEVTVGQLPLTAAGVAQENAMFFAFVPGNLKGAGEGGQHCYRRTTYVFGAHQVGFRATTFHDAIQLVSRYAYPMLSSKTGEMLSVGFVFISHP